MNTKGVATQNHRANKAIKVVNGIAAELPFAQRTRFKTKNIPKITLKFHWIVEIKLEQRNKLPWTSDSCHQNILLPILSTECYQTEIKKCSSS